MSIEELSELYTFPSGNCIIIMRDCICGAGVGAHIKGMVKSAKEADLMVA